MLLNLFIEFFSDGKKNKKFSGAHHLPESLLKKMNSNTNLSIFKSPNLQIF